MITEVESSKSSLDTVSVIGPASTLKPDTYYDTTIRGCAKKCPCRVWAQCHRYVDITERQKRVKYKDNKIWEEIHSWYDNTFRMKYEYSDIFGNG
jgi:glutamate racemase